MAWYKLFGFIKKVFFTTMTFFSFNVLSVNSLECISMKNQEFKVREEVINVNANNPVFYPFSVKAVIIALEIVITAVIHMLDYVFQMLLKT